MKRHVGNLSLLVSLLLLFGSCKSLFGGTEKIADIIKSPSKFDGKMVTVKGKVSESFLVLGTGFFAISDESGSITVVPSKTFPKVNEEVEIEGTVKNAFVVGDKNLIVILEKGEENKRPAN